MSAELRSRATAIAADRSLSSLEKTAAMQRLFSSSSALCAPSSSAPPAVPAVLRDNAALSCAHYKTKRCSRLRFSCCGGVVDPCHRCHLARGGHAAAKSGTSGKAAAAPHALQVDSVQCNDCGERQRVGTHCTRCGVQFARSHCAVCVLWTDLEIFHCAACGVCRVGRKEEMFHCATCDACFSLSAQSSHRCAVQGSLRDALCAVCLESVHGAQRAAHILPCGHVLHGDCWRRAAQSGEYRCPCCRKSLVDMRRVWAAMRESVVRQPIPRGFFALREGDIALSKWGEFRVTRRRCGREEEREEQREESAASQRALTTTLSSEEEQQRERERESHREREQEVLCEGEFTAWRGRGTLRERELEKRRDVRVLCNDCGARGESLFHFVGVECMQCGSFNTVRE